MKTPVCPQCKSTNWVVKGSSNCICQDCGNLWIITAANAHFKDRVVK